MTGIRLTRRQEEALQRYERKFEQLKKKLDDLEFVMQGSVTERWMKCGKATCRCHKDPRALHGPYYQLSWKSLGRTSSIYLSKEQATLCKRWIRNNRRLANINKQLRTLSLRVARLYNIAPK